MLVLLRFALAADPVIATIDGTPLTRSALDAAAATIPNYRPEMEPRLIERLVEIELLAAEARRRKLGGSKADKLRLEMARREVMASLAVDAYLAEKTTETELQAWYDQHPEQFALPQARAHHILVQTETEADALLHRVQAGEPFETVADQASADPSVRLNHGDLGWFAREQMVGPFAEAVFGNEAGATLKVQTQFGWHVVRVDARRQTIPFSEVKEDIAAEMRDSLVETLLTDLKKDARIEMK